jgi:hypothetical protein
MFRSPTMVLTKGDCFSRHLTSTLPPPRRTPAVADLRSQSSTIRILPVVISQASYSSAVTGLVTSRQRVKKAKAKPYGAIHQRRPVHTHKVYRSITQHIHYRRKTTSSVSPLANLAGRI